MGANPRGVTQNFYPDLISKFSTIQERQVANQTHLQGRQRTSLRGKMKDSVMKQTILKPKNLAKELLSIHTVALSLAGIQRRPPNSNTQPLPVIAIGQQNLEFETKRIQDLEALADVGLVIRVEDPLKSQEVYNMRSLADNLPPAGALPSLEEQMTQAYQNDTLATEIFDDLKTGAQ